MRQTPGTHRRAGATAATPPTEAGKDPMPIERTRVPIIDLYKSPCFMQRIRYQP